MNKILTFFASVLLTATTFAQAPEKMSYQAVVRDDGDKLVTSQPIGMQISILQTTATGTAVYVETQTPTTNTNGLVSLEIGKGSIVSGDFTTIDWSAGPYFIKTETDPTGATNYTITGTSQLLSVPYALHAKTSGSNISKVLSNGNDAEANQIKNVGDPSDDQDAATKLYIDNLILQIGSIEDLLTAGFTLEQLLRGGHTVTELLNAGFTPKELVDAGASVVDLLDADLTYQDIIDAGADLVEFMDATGTTTWDLHFNYGVSIVNMLEDDITFTDMINDTISISYILQRSWGEHGFKHYFSVSDLLNEGISDTTLTASGLTTQQTVDKNLQIRLNNGETPIQIYESDTSLLNDIYGKIYQGGYITYLETDSIASPISLSYGQGHVIAKEYYGQYPSCFYGVSPQTNLAWDRKYRDGMTDGYSRTQEMDSFCAPESNAATICWNLEYGGYDDWYLPDLSIMEYYMINYMANSTLWDIPNSANFDNMLHSSPMLNGSKVHAMRNGFRRGLWLYLRNTTDEGFFYPTRDF